MFVAMADNPDLGPGMQLRNRQLRGVVPPVPPKETNVAQVETSLLSTIAGTVRRKLVDWFSPSWAGGSPDLPNRQTDNQASHVDQACSTPIFQGDQPCDINPVDTEFQDEFYDARGVPQPVVNNFHNCTFGSSDHSSVTTTRRPKLPAFDPSKMDLEAYLANFAAVTRGWSSDDKLLLMREKLEGTAAKVLASLDLQEEAVTLNRLEAALKQHFVGERSEWMAKLRSITRESDETLDDLAFRIRLYSRRAYGKLQDDLGLQFYLAVRDGPLGDRLYEYKESTLDDILRRAKSYESHLLATNQPTTSGMSRVNVAAMDNSEISHAYQSRGHNSFQQGRGRGRQNPGGQRRGYGQGRGTGDRYSAMDRRWNPTESRCHVCGVVGHRWRDCPQVEGHVAARMRNPAPSNGNAIVASTPPENQ